MDHGREEDFARKSPGRLTCAVDESALRAFIRNEMWQFLLDMGWTAGAEPPPMRQAPPVDLE